MNKQILFVEDDEFLRDLAITKLSKAGFEVIFAKDGEEGKAKYDANAQTIAMMLFDIMLPKMTGLELLEYIRTQGAKKDVPAIMFTNFADDDSIKTAQRLGIAEYLIKSNFTLDELCEKITEHTK